MHGDTLTAAPGRLSPVVVQFPVSTHCWRSPMTGPEHINSQMQDIDPYNPAKIT
jgi:hypothetical protein